MRYRNIEAERARNGLTKDALASELGVSTKTYGNWINGITPIPSDVLLEMSHLFQKKIDYLLDNNDEKLDGD